MAKPDDRSTFERADRLHPSEGVANGRSRSSESTVPSFNPIGRPRRRGLERTVMEGTPDRRRHVVFTDCVKQAVFGAPSTIVRPAMAATPTRCTTGVSEVRIVVRASGRTALPIPDERAEADRRLRPVEGPSASWRREPPDPRQADRLPRSQERIGGQRPTEQRSAGAGEVRWSHGWQRLVGHVLTGSEMARHSLPGIGDGR